MQRTSENCSYSIFNKLSSKFKCPQYYKKYVFIKNNILSVSQRNFKYSSDFPTSSTHFTTEYDLQTLNESFLTICHVPQLTIMDLYRLTSVLNDIPTSVNQQN